jgi:beta-lactamase superfamily II metal-dependent hydrolase
MLQLHVIQAAFGDSLLLEYGEKSKYILIDGGPKDVYNDSLRPEIDRIIGKGVLEALIITHVDMDHIKGILDLLTELKRQTDAQEVHFIKIKDLWLNSFSNTLDTSGEIATKLAEVRSASSNSSKEINAVESALLGVKEGFQVTRLANMLGIPMNTVAPNGLFTVDTNETDIMFDELSLTIIGPTQSNLDALRTDWINWLDNREQEIADGKFDILAFSDNSVPNLSSLMFLIKENDKTILFTGDGRGDHLIQGLRAKNLLINDKMHVNIFKVPHHGSARNSNKMLYENITADTYVISANGKNGNPDLITLSWIVESAKESGRNIRIVVTNETETTKKLIASYPPVDWTYTIEYIPQGKMSVTL